MKIPFVGRKSSETDSAIPLGAEIAPASERADSPGGTGGPASSGTGRPASSHVASAAPETAGPSSGGKPVAAFGRWKNVVILGFVGSGKTVFLTMLYHATAKRHDLGEEWVAYWHDAKTNEYLGENANLIVGQDKDGRLLWLDTEQTRLRRSFPPATLGDRMIHFTLKRRWGGLDLPLSVRTMEIPGEVAKNILNPEALTGEFSEQRERLLRLCKDSHSVLFMLNLLHLDYRDDSEKLHEVVTGILLQRRHPDTFAFVVVGADVLCSERDLETARNRISERFSSTFRVLDAESIRYSIFFVSSIGREMIRKQPNPPPKHSGPDHLCPQCQELVDDASIMPKPSGMEAPLEFVFRRSLPLLLRWAPLATVWGGLVLLRRAIFNRFVTPAVLGLAVGTTAVAYFKHEPQLYRSVLDARDFDRESILRRASLAERYCRWYRWNAPAAARIREFTEVDREFWRVATCAPGSGTAADPLVWEQKARELRDFLTRHPETPQAREARAVQIEFDARLAAARLGQACLTNCPAESLVETVRKEWAFQPTPGAARDAIAEAGQKAFARAKDRLAEGIKGAARAESEVSLSALAGQLTRVREALSGWSWQDSMSEAEEGLRQSHDALSGFLDTQQAAVQAKLQVIDTGRRDRARKDLLAEAERAAGSESFAEAVDQLDALDRLCVEDGWQAPLRGAMRAFAVHGRKGVEAAQNQRWEQAVTNFEAMADSGLGPEFAATRERLLRNAESALASNRFATATADLRRAAAEWRTTVAQYNTFARRLAPDEWTRLLGDTNRWDAQAARFERQGAAAAASGQWPGCGDVTAAVAACRQHAAAVGEFGLRTTALEQLVVQRDKFQRFVTTEARELLRPLMPRSLSEFEARERAVGEQHDKAVAAARSGDTALLTAAIQAWVQLADAFDALSARETNERDAQLACGSAKAAFESELESFHTKFPCQTEEPYYLGMRVCEGLKTAVAGCAGDASERLPCLAAARGQLAEARRKGNDAWDARNQARDALQASSAALQNWSSSKPAVGRLDGDALLKKWKPGPRVDLMKQVKSELTTAAGLLGESARRAGTPVEEVEALNACGRTLRRLAGELDALWSVAEWQEKR